MIPDGAFRRCGMRRIIRFMASATPASRPADGAPAVPVHAEPLAALWERTGSRPGGLTPEEVEQRRGTAAVRTEGSRTMAVLGELVESVVEPLQLLLVVVGVLSAIFGELRDAIAIFAIIALVSAVEAISEVRAKRALGRCATSAPPTRSSGARAPWPRSRSTRSSSATCCSSRPAAWWPPTPASSRPTAWPPTSRG